MLDFQDWERLSEIRDEMADLLEEAKQLIRRSGDKFAYERARAYWLGDMDNALYDGKSWDGTCNMEETIRALDPGEESDEDDEELEEEVVG
jgi:hypothetical protein